MWGRKNYENTYENNQAAQDKAIQNAIMLLFAHLEEHGVETDALNEKLLDEVIARIMGATAVRLMRNVELWIGDAEQDRLHYEGEDFSLRMWIGRMYGFDGRRLGTGHASEDEIQAIRNIRDLDVSIERLAKVFKRNEKTIRRYI